MTEIVSPKFLVFLDFDGVLHPVDANEHERFNPEAVSSINRILDELDAKLVLSTAWRMDYGFDHFNAWFNGKIIGSTPVHNLDLKIEYPRFNEVINFLKLHEWICVPWISIDDKRSHFPINSPAYITDSKIGITKKDTENIIKIGHSMKFLQQSLLSHLNECIHTDSGGSS